MEKKGNANDVNQLWREKQKSKKRNRINVRPRDERKQNETKIK